MSKEQINLTAKHREEAIKGLILHQIHNVLGETNEEIENTVEFALKLCDKIYDTLKLFGYLPTQVSEEEANRLYKSLIRSACEGYQDCKIDGVKQENFHALMNVGQMKEWAASLTAHQKQHIEWYCEHEEKREGHEYPKCEVQCVYCKGAEVTEAAILKRFGCKELYDLQCKIQVAGYGHILNASTFIDAIQLSYKLGFAPLTKYSTIKEKKEELPAHISAKSKDETETSLSGKHEEKQGEEEEKPDEKDEHCPKCDKDYDSLDYAFQICSQCGYVNPKSQTK